MTNLFRGTRQFPRGQRIRSILTQEPAPLNSDLYPLVEIVPDPTWDGHWLYLHPTPAGTVDPPVFVRCGESLTLKASTMLGSYYARSTPIREDVPAPVALVYTSADHLRR